MAMASPHPTPLNGNGNGNNSEPSLPLLPSLRPISPTQRSSPLSVNSTSQHIPTAGARLPTQSPPQSRFDVHPTSNKAFLTNNDTHLVGNNSHMTNSHASSTHHLPPRIVDGREEVDTGREGRTETERVTKAFKDGLEVDAVGESLAKQLNVSGLRDGTDENEKDEAMRQQWLVEQFVNSLEACNTVLAELQATPSKPPPNHTAKPRQAGVRPSGDRGRVKEEDEEETAVRRREWLFRRSTEANPASCMIYLEVPPGRVACGPRPRPGEHESLVTFQVLNKLRRTDPQKLRDLWYDQFDADFGPIIDQLPTGVLVLSSVIDNKVLLRSASAVGGVAALYTLRHPLGRLLLYAITSPSFWAQYQYWKRLSWAPLPLKLFLVRTLVLAVREVGVVLEDAVIERLTALEGGLIERYLPVEQLTI